MPARSDGRESFWRKWVPYEQLLIRTPLSPGDVQAAIQAAVGKPAWWIPPRFFSNFAKIEAFREQLMAERTPFEGKVWPDRFIATPRVPTGCMVVTANGRIQRDVDDHTKLLVSMRPHGLFGTLAFALHLLLLVVAVLILLSAFAPPNSMAVVIGIGIAVLAGVAYSYRSDVSRFRADCLFIERVLEGRLAPRVLGRYE